MSAVTRELHTEQTAELRLIGPSDNKKKVIHVAEALGFFVKEDSRPWEELFEEPTPGRCLRGARHKEGLTQRQLAEQTGIPQRHISEMENDKRSIGKYRARILAKALNTAGYRVFL